MAELKRYFFSNVRMKCRNGCTFSKVKSIINLSDFEENVQNYCMVVWPFEKTYFALHSQFLGFPKKMSQGGVLKIDSPSSILRQKNCSPTEQIYQVPKKNPCTIHSVSKKMTLISRLIKNLLINKYIALNHLFSIMHSTT